MTMRERNQFSGQSGEPKDTVELGQDRVGEVKEQIQEKASHLVEKAQEQAQSQIMMQRDKAVSTLSSVASALRQTGQTLREQEQAPFAEFANKAAEQVEHFSSYLQNHEPRQLMMDVERFARRQPALFIGGAFVLGLLGARFLKSSSEHEQREMWERQQGYGGGNFGGGQYGYGSQYGNNFGGQYGYGSQFGGNFGEQNTGQYGGQYSNQYGGQYGGEQYTSYPRTYEGDQSSMQSPNNFDTTSGRDRSARSSQRSGASGESMLFGNETEER